MDEQNTNQDQLNQQQNRTSQATQQVSKKAKEKLRKRIANSIKSGAAKQSLMAALGPILLWGFVIIVILIIAIGIAMFLVTMPGMVMEQLKALFKEAGNFIAAFFGADTTKQIENTEIYSTLDYLEQMGWDLKGEGFLTDYVKSENDLDKEANKDNGVNLDEKTGVLRDDDDKIITAKSDFIFTYMVSDNYVYTIKNHNLATQKDSDNWLTSFLKGIATSIYKYYNALFGPVFDFLGITEAYADAWGRGLLAFYYDEGVGIKGNYVNTATIWNWDSIEIDTESKKLLIRRSELFNNNNAMEFSLDGWTGRYGMPLEFLLAIHKSTMMPDLAYDMATTFNTNVNIYLHDVSGEAITAYSAGGKYIDYPTLEEATSVFKGKNFFSALINWFDDLIDSDAEIAAAKDLGIDIGDGNNGCECEYSTVLVDETGENVVEEKDGKLYYKNGEEYTGTTQTVTSITKGCSQCRNKLGTIKSLLNKDNDYNFKAYHPYIASVTEHWYRDVYFVLNNQNKDFVDYDYDYEIMTGERWTLYETDDEGNFVYYKLNDDGSTGEKYEGTVIEGEVEYVKGEKSEILRLASIGEDGTKVVKKAVTFNSSDTTKMTDLGWNKNTEEVWSAYEENQSESQTGYERLYTDEELADDEDKEIKSKIYINVKTTGNIVQTGEGQRTETNSDIKKMFLQNNYFRYDGTYTTAEIITAMREKLYSDKKEYYGAVSNSNAKKELELNFDDAKYTSEAQNGKYKVSDYVGNVTLNQDSLNAFTMLENTHTLDADYIYRDFKELVVELGYFTKEELTDETPKLLQWIVPDIGSSGFPDVLDKRENEFGTMVHSKSDILANKVKTLREKIRAAASEENQGKDASQYPTSSHQSSTTTSVSGINLTNVSGISESAGATKKPEEVSVEEFLAAADEVHKVIEDLKFEYCWGAGNSHNSDNPHTDGHGCAGLFNTLEEASASGGHRIDCSTYVSYVLQAVDLMTGRTYTGSPGGGDGFYGLFADYIITREEAGELQPGDILLSASHIQINGENNLQYNAGSGEDIRKRPYEANPSFYTHVIRLPFNGNTKSKGEPYEGYEGNEAVVSPVTGILLDYGVYDKVEKTSTTIGQDQRLNVDLKYGYTNIYENQTEEGKGQTNNTDPNTDNSGFESQEVYDAVGYAKILVLDAENYQKLESKTGNTWKTDSLVRVDQTTVELGDTDQVTSNRVSFREAIDGTRSKTEKEEDYSGEYEDWTELDKTIYGYKEFAETYEKYGIAGYVVYIDGFKCELPDESLSGGEEGESDGTSDIASQIPKGKTLTMESFKQTETQINAEENEDSLIQTKYESDEAYKLASEKSTNKLSAEVDLKTQAAASISINDGGKDIIFIKEGTVIGRTLTDKELLESEDFRNGEYGTYEELRGEEKATTGTSTGEAEDDDSKLIGNYLRIMLKDEEGTTVENVEDYMKLDEGESKKTSEIDWEFWYFSPYEGAGWDEEECGPEAVKDEAMYANNFDVGIIQWTTHPTLSPGGVQNFCKRAAELDSSLCSVLAKYGLLLDSVVVLQSNRTQMQKEFTEICNKDRDGFTQVQIQIAMEDYFDVFCQQNNCEWLKDAPSCVQGTVMSAAVCNGPYTKINLTQGDDEGNIKAAINNIRNTKPALEPRLQAQEAAALDILQKRVTIDEVETWVRKKQTPANYNWNER